MPALSADLILSRRDLRFMLFEWLDLPALTSRHRYRDQSREIYEDILDLSEDLALDLFAPHLRDSDIWEPTLDESGQVVIVQGVGAALAAYSEAGLLGLTLDEAVGGMQLPLLLASAVNSWFFAANSATAGYAMLTTAAANLLATNAARDQVDTWVPPMVEGRFFATMCLSEPQAGSSLADITTRAEPATDGTYRLFGTKMWISGGEHRMTENIIHMVLAKVPDAGVGVKGLGLFIVPRDMVDDDGTVGEPNDVTLAGINHKMGNRGTVNTVLSFGEGAHQPQGQPGAIGYLIGEPGSGLKYMFRMMNEARIAVGLGAMAVGYTGYLKSLQYARERPQGRPLGKRDPGEGPVAIIEHPDVRRMLLAQKCYVEGAMAVVLYCSRLHDEVETSTDEHEREQAHLLLEILTPIAKSWPSQWCLEANSLAIQVLGGYGYSREYDVEQHYRDNRLNPIHEGTHGIHGLDLLGRKVTMSQGAAFSQLVRMLRSAERDVNGMGHEAEGLSRSLAAAVDHFEATTRRAVESGPSPAMLGNASCYLEAAGHLVVASLWLSQFLASAGKTDPFYEGKRQACRYFFVNELPRAELLLDLVEDGDTTAFEMLDEWF